MAASRAPQEAFWNGKRVLVTGHTGFKGGWLTLWLHRLGANTTGIALAPETRPSLFEAAAIGDLCKGHITDIRDAEAVLSIARQEKPEIVFHLAAQPLVRQSYRDPLATLSSNVMGTANVLDAMRGLDSVRVVVVVTTDKVYANNEWEYPYRECDPLGGHDPYSASKAACELITTSYRDAYLHKQGVAVATARAGNVIGGGDWADDRLLPDAIRAWQTGSVLRIRSPDAIRPWQHVLEPVNAYLTLAEQLWARPEIAGAFNFGPPSNEARTVREIINQALTAHGAGQVAYEPDIDQPHEAGTLKLETAKAQHLLAVFPRWNVDEAVRRTVAWYRGLERGENARGLCVADISDFERLQ